MREPVTKLWFFFDNFVFFADTLAVSKKYFYEEYSTSTSVFKNQNMFFLFFPLEIGVKNS